MPRSYKSEHDICKCGEVKTTRAKRCRECYTAKKRRSPSVISNWHRRDERKRLKLLSEMKNEKEI
jgi:hypothetical protein